MTRHPGISGSRGLAPTLLFLMFACLAAGCATKGYVKERVAEAGVETDAKITGVRTDLDRTTARANEAYDKATLAERLASGTMDVTEVSSHEVRFAFDDWRLNDDASATLDDLATQLAAHPRYVLEIRGYADATGPNRYNYMLGRERAESVERDLITRHNVPPMRVAIVSFGEDDPAADNASSDGRAQNRRVRVRLLDVTPKPGETPVAVSE